MTPPDLAAANTSLSVATRQRPWWKGAVIYQIYPRSFLDTNGDGVGDLKGIIDKLDYVADLGVDAVWLSPIFTSPMRDFGYDVADYCGIDPLFGTLADFDALIDKAHRLGLRIVIDQVYSHTSDKHAWFEESRQSRDNPKADWYVWADPKPDGTPPNNWQSVFGGPAWEWDARRRQYYLHNFLVEQPDLNVHNRQVQDALLDVARFWFDRGVDGFRLDAINFAMHDPELRDNPAVTAFKRPPTRPFDFQNHIRSQSHPDIVKFLERIREVCDAYPDRFTVAEIGGPNALPEMKAFTKGETRLNTAYSFEYLYAPSLTAEYVGKVSADWPNGKEGWPSWAFSNHDAPRAVSRWADGVDRRHYARMTLLLLMSLRGNAFLYQGEELGLVQGEVPFERLQDPEAIANWPETLGRDGARTPMPWARKDKLAGFSTVEPWLPIDARHHEDAVDQQADDPASTLSFAKAAIALRKSEPALALGDIDFEKAPDGLLVFERTHDGAHALCVFNLSDKPVTWKPKEKGWTVALSNAIDANLAPPATLKPGDAYVAVKK